MSRHISIFWNNFRGGFASALGFWLFVLMALWIARWTLPVEYISGVFTAIRAGFCSL